MRFSRSRTATPPATPARQRARIRYDESEDMYNRVTRWVDIAEDPQGHALTSRLGNGRHAPVLDVDMPVTTAPHPAGTAVTFTGKFKLDRLTRALHHLVKTGLIDPATTHLLDAAVLDAQNTRWYRWTGSVRLRRVTVVFTYPVLAPGSKTPGHHHLLCETSMDWEQAKALAAGLATAGLVDVRFESISRLGDFMWVNQPIERTGPAQTGTVHPPERRRPNIPDLPRTG